MLQSLTKAVPLILRNTPVAIPVLAALISGGLFAIYALQVAPDFISRDQWRFLYLIEELKLGQLTFADLWESHSPHRIPAYKAWFIANTALFSGNQRVEILVGNLFLLAFLGLTMMALVQAAARSHPQFHGSHDFSGALLLGSILCLGLTTNHWSNAVFGLTAFGYVKFLLFLLTWLSLEKRFYADRPTAVFQWWMALVPITLLLFAAGTGIAWVASTTVGIVAWCLLSKRPPRAFAPSLTIFMALTFACQAIYWLTPGLPDDATVGSAGTFPSLAVAGKAFVWGLSSSILDLHVQKLLGISKSAGFALGLAVLSVHLVAGAIIVKHSTRASTFLPMQMAAYTYAFLCAVILSRVAKYDAFATASPRYIFNYMMANIAALAVMYICLRPGSLARRFAGIAAIFVSLSIVIVSFHGRMTFLPYQLSSQQKTMSEIFRASILGRDARIGTCPDGALCVRSLRRLEEWDLRPFAGSEQCSIEIDAYGVPARSKGRGAPEQVVVWVNGKFDGRFLLLMVDEQPIFTRQTDRQLTGNFRVSTAMEKSSGHDLAVLCPLSSKIVPVGEISLGEKGN